MKAICIVQARMNSSRLPGKVLLPLNGHTVIGEVLTRCKKIKGIDEVVCAVPYGVHDKLTKEAGKFATVIHGPEDDVLDRYYIAALKTRADIIMRITADCPLISPELCGAVLQKLIDEKADYASNIEPRTFPKGMDCEVFTHGALLDACMYSDQDDCEHVTPWMRRSAMKRVNVASPWPIEGRLTLDTEDDYRVICAAFGHKPFEHLRAA